MAQYPPEVQIHLLGGNFVIGNQAVGEMFASVFKPYTLGGLKGIKFNLQLCIHIR